MRSESDDQYMRAISPDATRIAEAIEDAAGQIVDTIIGVFVIALVILIGLPPLLLWALT